MASLFSITRQALLPICRRQTTAIASSSVLARRSLHASSVAYKKKPKPSVLEKQEFDDFEFEEDELVSMAVEESPTSTRTKGPKRGKLTPEAREARFNEQYDFVKSHIGRKPTATDAKQVRNSSWTHLFGLAASEEQLRHVADMFADWITVDRQFKDQQVLLFVQRCHELKCPELAVEVFSNRPYYRFDMTSVEVARELLHSVLKESLFKQSLLVSTLYTLYNLPPLAKDIISCSMLLSQCLAVDTPDARVIAGALLPAFKQSVENTPSLEAAQKDIVGSNNLRDAKHLTWLRIAAGTIENRLSARGEDMAWLREWRVANGHMPSPRPKVDKKAPETKHTSEQQSELSV